MTTWTYEDVRNQFGIELAAVLCWDEFAPQLADAWDVEDLLRIYGATLPGTEAWRVLRETLEARATRWDDIEDVVDTLPQGDELRERFIGRLVEGATTFEHWLVIAHSQPSDARVRDSVYAKLFALRREVNYRQWVLVLLSMPDRSKEQERMLREASAEDVDWYHVFREAYSTRPYLASRAWRRLCREAQTRDLPELWVDVWRIVKELGDVSRQRRALAGLRACRAELEEWEVAEASLWADTDYSVADIILLKIAEGGDLDFGGDLIEEFQNPRRFSREGVEKAMRAFVAVDGLDAHELLDVYRALSNGEYDEAILAEILDRAMAREAPADTWMKELESFENRDDDHLLERALVARLVQCELTLEQAAYVYECAAKLGMRTAQVSLLHKMLHELAQPS